ncbi:hypothetical protein EMIT0158MI4_110197 [Burkholderia ambifaria]
MCVPNPPVKQQTARGPCSGPTLRRTRNANVETLRYEATETVLI